MSEVETPRERGKANAAGLAAQQQLTGEPNRDYDEITYLPGEGDQARTECWGIRFEANKPVKVKRTQAILVPIRVRKEMEDGRTVSHSPETRMPIVELARTNPSFSVNGAPPSERKANKVRLPDTPDEYRSYAMRWINGTNSLEELVGRWAGEAPLREACGVSNNDMQWLMPFYEGRKTAFTGHMVLA